MFRRPGKNPLEKDSSSSLYKEETPTTPYQKYGMKKSDVGQMSENPARLYEPSPSSFFPMEEKSINEEAWMNEKPSTIPHHFQGSLKEEAPETTLGEGVTFRGELSFERLLRIDGTFEGELLSQGKVIVGPKGKVTANLNLREAIIEGEVKGNITVQERLELRGEAAVYGDIRAKTLSVDEGVTLVGTVKVMPQGDVSSDF